MKHNIVHGRDFQVNCLEVIGRGPATDFHFDLLGKVKSVKMYYLTILPAPSILNPIHNFFNTLCRRVQGQ